MNNKIKTLFAVSIVLPAIASALPEVPSAPTASDFESPAACTAYATKLSNWATAQDTNDADFLNSFWLNHFADTRSMSQYSQVCNNGVCTNYFGVNEKGRGVLSGCSIAVSSSQEVKQAMLQVLSSIYQLTIQHQTLSAVYASNQFGLYGLANVCPDMRAAGCMLKK